MSAMEGVKLDRCDRRGKVGLVWPLSPANTHFELKLCRK